MRIPNIYSEIPRLSPAVIDQIGRHFGFESASDFDPVGDKKVTGIPWKRISEAVLVRDGYSCRSCGKSTFSDIPKDNPSHSIHLSVQKECNDFAARSRLLYLNVAACRIFYLKFPSN